MLVFYGRIIIHLPFIVSGVLLLLLFLELGTVVGLQATQWLSCFLIYLEFDEILFYQDYQQQ